MNKYYVHRIDLSRYEKKKERLFIYYYLFIYYVHRIDFYYIFIIN